jgi:transposase
MAPNGQLMHYDDTGNHILEAKKRAVHTTSFISMCGTYPIYLFFTSLNTAGKNQEELLKNRTTKEPLMTMTDASRHNFPKYMDEELMARWILCFCLVHGRRKFYEIRHFFGKACEFVLDTIGAIYHHEDYCKKHHLDPQARLNYHQQHSAPLMEGLRIWFNNQLLYHYVEEHSGLGQAIRYMLKHWEGLTRFLHVAGAPIDNSICEQAIKVAIRHRRNSLFYRTFKSAQIGDGLMSVIHTAAKNHINIFDYLNTLQRHKGRVKEAPADWLPWNYQQTLHHALAA